MAVTRTRLYSFTGIGLLERVEFFHQAKKSSPFCLAFRSWYLPSSIALLEFHFLLLIGNRVKDVNRISEQIVEELEFDKTSETTSKGIIGLSIDASPGCLYAYDENSIFQVSINRLLLEDVSPDNRNSEYKSIINYFRASLSDSKDVLDEATTMKLLESLEARPFGNIPTCDSILLDATVCANNMEFRPPFDDRSL
ncbi:hypothetical protein LXL04_037841 [Taraxacum kok-saghyz]